jgi:ribose transport system substrate-binding protein
MGTKCATRRLGLRHALASGVCASLFSLSANTVTAGDACKPHRIDLGAQRSIEGGCAPLKIAIVMAGTNNVYLQANMRGAKDAAATAAASVDFFDAAWSPTTHFNLLQVAISGGKYNAIITAPYEGNQSCEQVTKTAPEHGILVLTVNSPACGRASKAGDDLWSPGTLAFVGGIQGRAAYHDWFFGIAKANPGKQKVAVVTGPDLIANTTNIDLAVADVQKAYPDFTIVGVVRTDYSVSQGYDKFAPLLQANPDLSIVISNYSDMTRGIMQAIKQASRAGQVKVYDFGGNKWAFEAVRRGELQSTLTMTPYTEYKKAVETVVAAWNGQTTPRYVPLSSIEITAANADKEKPEF